MDSKYHMMRGMIALAWADGVLDPGEVVVLERFIENNRHLTPAQRVELKASIATPLSIKDVWDSITDMQDRARLIDVAGAIFHADGDYSASEKKVYDEMMDLHLASMHRNANTREMQNIADKARMDAKIAAQKQEAAYKAQVKQDAKAAPSKMGLLMYRINQVMGN